MRAQAAAVAMVLLALAVICSSSAIAAEKDVRVEEREASMFLYDARHSGAALEPITVPIALSWKHTAAPEGGGSVGHLVSSPAADAESVFFFVGSDMYALSRDTGASRWEKPLTLPGIVDSTPLVKDGVAVFGCRNGNVYFVDVSGESGKRLGTFDLKREHKVPRGVTATPGQSNPQVQSSPIYHDGAVFFGGDDGWLTALDFASREKIWEFKTKGPIKASPTYWNHGIYVASMDGNVYGISEVTGRLRWRTTLTDDGGEVVKNLLASPVVTHSKVLAAAGKYLFACDHGKHGYIRWRFKAKGNIIGAPAAFEDPDGLESRVFVADSEGTVYALDIGSGEVIWQVPPENEEAQGGGLAPGEVAVDGTNLPVKSSLTVVEDAVVFRAGPRQVNALSIADGVLVWHYALSEAAGVAGATTGTGGLMGGLGVSGGLSGLPGLGGTTGRTGASGATTTQPVAPPLVFEQETASSPVAAGDSLYVVADDGALYAFRIAAADATAPEFDEAGIEVPGQGGSRYPQAMKLYRSGAALSKVGDDDKLKIPGSPPVYVRVKVFDEGSGIAPQTIAALQEMGGEDVVWEGAYDAKGGYLWAIYDPSRRRNLPDGEYVLSIEATDWSGNVGKRVVCFIVDNAMPVPGGVAPGARPGALPGMGMPGMGMPGMGMPGMGMPGAPGGMPGGGGAPPGMPGMP